ncbi:lysophospholipid acyltransferase family protein [Magnetospirillum sp. 15-1]|uniref:lysophospholipid acyltransferase family protein n=1 Tax=Magnetospirillum sp. 15-1 TaxID=1979370 RepID=UPI000BBC8F4D|nr:lysophospholipid acyltransferase family protein [Magnetospirillum sp. 15-1]
MGLAKRIGKSEGLRGLLCWLGSLYIRLVYLTGRWQVVNGGHAQALWDQGKPFILAFWHGRILMMPKSWRQAVPIHMLISQHRDGQLIARTVSHFGIDTVQGSTTRGGSAALRAMLKFLKNGECVGITPDGPKGPRMRASDGIVAVARLAGVPILPATFATSRRKLLGSWDRFAVALPFSRGVFVWGDPITVPKEADDTAMEAARQAVEDHLNAITRDADARMGQETPDPADRP